LIWDRPAHGKKETSFLKGENPSNKAIDFSGGYGNSGLFWTAVIRKGNGEIHL